MVGLRKIPVWLVLASYLFANTLASAWHDHHEHGACPSAAAEHHQDHHHHHDHCSGHHHHHDGDQDEHKGAGDQNQGGTPHHCVVCEFLALAPLPATVPALIAAGETVPAEVVQPVVRLSAVLVQAHPARGPPAAV